MTVPLTQDEQNSALHKYLKLDISPTPPDVADRILEGNFDPAGGLLPTEMNRLFDDGYLTGEFGWYHLSDGGIMVANLTPMPRVTPEMFDWWFAWHGLSSLRYKIWDKDDHHYCKTRNPETAMDSTLSMKQRYWHTTHDIKESLLDGQPPVDICLSFVPPETVGFAPERLKNFSGTIVCTPGPAIMTHFIRPTQDGCELRTRFWIGYQAVNNSATRIPEFDPDEGFAKALLIHNVKEFTHLAKILPEVYHEFQNNFTVQ